jgi:calcineurin-like phosphoesterase family protein
VIDHYPGYSWQESHKSCWQLFGHVHGAENAKRRQDPAWSLSIDVGVDSHDFKPWLWKEELVPLFADRKPAFDRWHKQKYSGKGGGGMAPQGPV